MHFCLVDWSFIMYNICCAISRLKACMHLILDFTEDIELSGFVMYLGIVEALDEKV